MVSGEQLRPRAPRLFLDAPDLADPAVLREASVDPPQILFGLTQNDTRYIQRLLRSIELANRVTQLRWLIELSLQHEIVYILRPRFWRPPHEITPTDVALAKADLPVLARRLRRDLSLSWWRDDT